MNQVLEKMYETHHSTRGRSGFTILGGERGAEIAKLVGKAKKVLDIGCRDGALTKFFAEGNDVLGVDIDKNALEKIQKDLGIKTMFFDLNGDWQELGSEMFDAVVAGEIIEHLFYPDRVFARIFDHLKPDGMLIGTVPNAFSLKNRLRYLKGSKVNTPLSDPTHVNHFNAKELRSLLEKKYQSVEIIGLGRYKMLARLFPAWFAFDLLFVAKK